MRCLSSSSVLLGMRGKWEFSVLPDSLFHQANYLMLILPLRVPFNNCFSTTGGSSTNKRANGLVKGLETMRGAAEWGIWGLGAPLLHLQRASPLADMCKYPNCLFYQSARAATALLTQGADWRPKAICQVEASAASTLQTRPCVKGALSFPMAGSWRMPSACIT